MPHLVIFDMDGVLIDSYRAHFESWQQVAADEGVTYTEKEFAWSFGRTSREIIKGTWGHPEYTDDQIRAIDARKEARFREIVGRDFPMMDGAPDLIAALRQAGFRVAVGSSAPPENVALVLEKLGGAHLFAAVVNGMDVQRGKPDPQVFLLAAARAGVEPRDCVVVEDARPGIEAARRAGMASVALVSTGRHEDDFRPVHPDLVVRSLRNVNPRMLHALIDNREQATARTRPEMSTPFTPAPVKPTVPLSVLESLDIRLGTIAAVDDVAGSKKLVKLAVSFGDHRRTILAGMKQERAEPRDLVGRQALFVVNLEPKRMAGEISEGMVLDIGYADGLVPALAVPEREVPDGARAG